MKYTNTEGVSSLYVRVCQTRKPSGVNNSINASWIPFGFRFQVLFLRSHYYLWLRHLNTTRPTLMLLVTSVRYPTCHLTNGKTQLCETTFFNVAVPTYMNLSMHMGISPNKQVSNRLLIWLWVWLRFSVMTVISSVKLLSAVHYILALANHVKQVLVATVFHASLISVWRETFALKWKNKCACLQVAARRASWFWIGRATSCTQPTWETLGSWWSEEGRWSIAQTSSSTTLTHPSSCQLHPRGLKGPSSVTGKMPNSLFLCALAALHTSEWMSWDGQRVCTQQLIGRKPTHGDNRSTRTWPRCCDPHRQQCSATVAAVLCWACWPRAAVSRCRGVPSSSTPDLSARQSLGVCQAFPLTRVKVCVGWGANWWSHSQSCSSRLSHLFSPSSRRQIIVSFLKCSQTSEGRWARTPDVTEEAFHFF